VVGEVLVGCHEEMTPRGSDNSAPVQAGSIEG
jgi:hypothetical protein